MKKKFLVYTFLFLGMFCFNFSNVYAVSSSMENKVAIEEDEEEGEEEEDYYDSIEDYHCFYVDAKTTNLYSEPSVNSSVEKTLYKYDVFGSFNDNYNPNDKWLFISYYDPIEEKEYSGYVENGSVKELTAQDFFPQSKLKKRWTLLSNKWDESTLYFDFEDLDSYIAYLEIGKKVNGDIKYVLSEKIDCVYEDGKIYENELPFYYNEETGVLLFYGFLWKEDGDNLLSF